MSDGPLPKDMRGFRYRVRFRIGECEVEAEIGRAAMHETFQSVRDALMVDLQLLQKLAVAPKPPAS